MSEDAFDSDDVISDYASIAEAIKELVQDLGPVDHFIICPEDAREAFLKEHMDDLSGEVYYEVEGYKLYPSDECPAGLLGACVPDKPIGLS